ncbi:MAG: hypothetical protein IRZ28_10655 [Steroidobacteraceae bacterium]|nr:hypothetical protein [Steroidobacteraceae bacterium]
MVNLKLVEAFARYGATPSHRLHSLSAMAADGAMVLGCSAARFHHPSPGVLRYEDTLPEDPERASESAALGEHLTMARGENLPVRMIVIVEKVLPEGKTTREVHIRADLIGKVVQFDGHRYVVDFVRSGSPQEAMRNLNSKTPRR